MDIFSHNQSAQAKSNRLYETKSNLISSKKSIKNQIQVKEFNFESKTRNASKPNNASNFRKSIHNPTQNKKIDVRSIVIDAYSPSDVLN